MKAIEIKALEETLEKTLEKVTIEHILDEDGCFLEDGFSLSVDGIEIGDFEMTLSEDSQKICWIHDGKVYVGPDYTPSI